MTCKKQGFRSAEQFDIRFFQIKVKVFLYFNIFGGTDNVV